MPDHESRARWCVMVATLTSPAFREQAAAALTAMLPFLADWPDEAFCPATIEAVALAPRRQATPALDEIRPVLSAWWRANRPPQRAITGPDQTPSGTVTRDQHAIQTEWGNPDAVLAALASLDASYCPACPEKLDGPTAPCPACGEAMVPHPMRGQLGKLLGLAVAIHAPANLRLLPDAFRPDR